MNYSQISKQKSESNQSFPLDITHYSETHSPQLGTKLSHVPIMCIQICLLSFCHYKMCT